MRTYDAGSGVTARFEIRAVTGERIQVGSNLLSVGDTNPEVHVGADNLRATVRAGARRFDAEARWTQPDGLEDVGIRLVRRPQRRSTAPGWRMTADRRGGGRPAERAVRDKDGGAATDRRSRVPQRHPARHGVRSDAALRDRIRAQGPSRVGEPIQGESTEHALEGSASGGSPRRCNRLHPARARRDGDIDRDDPAVEVENVRAGGRSPRSTCNCLQVAVPAKPSRASPAVRHRAGNPGARSVGANLLLVGDTNGEVLGGDNLMVFLRVCASSTPRTLYRSRPVGAARRHTSGARRRAWRRRDSWCALAPARSGQGPTNR